MSKSATGVFVAESADGVDVREETHSKEHVTVVQQPNGYVQFSGHSEAFRVSVRWVLGLCCAGCEGYTFCSPILCTLEQVSAHPAQCHAQCKRLLSDVAPDNTGPAHQIA